MPRIRSATSRLPERELATRFFTLNGIVFTLITTVACVNHVIQGRSITANIASVGIMAGLQLLLIRGVNFQVLGNLHLLLVCGIVAFGAASYGGLSSPAAHWLGVLPILAGAILGPKGATRWTLVLLLASVAMFLWVPLRLGMEPLGYLITTAGSVLLTYFLFSVYDRAQRALQLQLRRERNESESLLRVLSHDLNPSLEVLDRLVSRQRATSGGLTPAELDTAEVAIRTIREIGGQARDWQMLGERGVNGAAGPVPVASLFPAVQGRFLPLLQGRRIRFEDTGGSGAGHRVNAAAPTLVNQVLGNLVSNAIKFTPEGGSIRFRAVRSGDEVHLLIADSGIGIPLHQQGKVFEFGASLTRVGMGGEPGTGFGLPIVASHVRQMGGRISLRSRERSATSSLHGTVFRIALPLARGSEKASLMSHRGGSRIYLRVLVIDDSEIYHEVMETVLKELGCQVRIARDSASALAALAEERFDAIFVDSFLGAERGQELAIRIREGGMGRRAKLFYFSGAAPSLDERSRDWARLFDGIVLKPVDRFRLEAVLRPVASDLPLADPVVLKTLDEVGQERGRTLLASLIRIFLESAPESLRNIREAIETKDSARLKACSHRLRSNAETLGLLRIARIAEWIEANSGEIANLEGAYSQLESEATSAFSYLRAFTHEERGENAQGETRRNPTP